MTGRPPDQRPSAYRRGYDRRHRAVREALLAQLVSGVTPCCRCGEPMHRGQQLDLDHTDDRQGYRGLAHAACNRSAGGARAHQMAPVDARSLERIRLEQARADPSAPVCPTCRQQPACGTIGGPSRCW